MVAFGNAGEQRAVLAAACERCRQQAGESGVRFADAALLVDNGDCHGRLVVEAGEAYFGGTQVLRRFFAWCAIDDQRA